MCIYKPDTALSYGLWNLSMIKTHVIECNFLYIWLVDVSTHKEMFILFDMWKLNKEYETPR